MHSTKLFSAVVAVGAATFAAEDIEISEPTPNIDCSVVDATITVGEDVAGELVIDGPEQLLGDLVIKNASGLLSVASSSINSIEGVFQLEELTALNSIRFDALETLNELTMIKLTRLSDLIFGTEGVTSATVVTITDTNLDDLSGLKLTEVDTLQIDNNKRLRTFDSQLVNITTSLIILSNGEDMEITLNDLEMASEIQISNVKSVEMSALATVDASLKLISNPKLESFAAPNLTEVTDSVTFRENDALANISLPELTKISGDLTVVNNTNLSAIDGFASLATVLGGINLGGNFDSVELPALEEVAGSVDVISSTDIENFCEFFDDAQGNIIEGEVNCESNDPNAVEGGDSTSDGNGGSSDDSDEEDAAGLAGVNTAFMALALVACFAQLL